MMELLNTSQNVHRNLKKKLKSYIRPLLSLSVVPVQTKFRLAEGRLSQTLTWASPLYFPPQKVMGNPDAPPAKSLIIKSTFCGNLPPFGLVQSTVFRIVWPVTNAFNNWIVCFGPQLVFNIRNTLKSMHLYIQQWYRCPFQGALHPSGS